MPGITGLAAQRFAVLTASVQRAADATTALGAAAEKAVPSLTNLELAMKATSTFAIALRDAMEGTGWRVNEGSAPTPQQQAYAQNVAQKLQDLETRLQTVFGTNNQYAAIIDRSLKEIQGGGDPAHALEVLRALLGAYGPGLQQEMMSTDPAIRELAQRLEMLVMGGQLF